MVQDLRGNIRVFCRVRPLGLTGDDTGRCVACETEEGTIFLLLECQIHGFVRLGTVLITNRGTSEKPKAFKFDKVFGEMSSQDEVYAESQPLIRSVLDGESFFRKALLST